MAAGQVSAAKGQQRGREGGTEMGKHCFVEGGVQVQESQGRCSWPLPYTNPLPRPESPTWGNLADMAPSSPIEHAGELHGVGEQIFPGDR